jgi:hypothetical protein
MAINQFPAPDTGGIPSGNTASRPVAPVIGDTYYNGQLGILEIYDGTEFVPCSAPAASPTIAVVDVGTSIAYGAARGNVTITPGDLGGLAVGYTVTSSTGGYSATSTSTNFNIITGNSGSYTFSATGYNVLGVSVASPTVTETLTTLPESPTIGTASTSGTTTDVVITWTLGSNGGKNLSAITITPYLNGTTAQTAATAATTSSTSYTFAGLTAASAYTFKVKTTNANGNSLESVATNSVTIPTLIALEFLAIGGGGAGGSISNNNGAGGGGAGGYLTSFDATQGGGASASSEIYYASGTTFTITVGAGGTGQLTTNTGDGTSLTANNGVASTIVSGGVTLVSALGGGGGGRNSAGAAGGSGGGGGASSTTLNGGSASSPTQGYAGGSGNGSGTAANRSGGGGGGAGAVGGNGSSAASPGNGGTGQASSITGSSITRAGGGGGAGHTYGSTSSGGSGGGGNGKGGNETTGNNGGTNTGGGGGGISRDPANGSTNVTSGAGGSGVVILRNPTVATATTGSPTYTNPSGGVHIYVFNGNGTITL